MNKMQFTTTLQKANILEANATGMKHSKKSANLLFFLNLEKTMRSSKHKKNLLLMIRKLQTRNIF